MLPDGDCFFESMHLLLPEDGRAPELVGPSAMRCAVAAAMTPDTFESYRIYGMAGVEGFEFMSQSSVSDLEGLQEFARRSGHDHGAGQCLWADEFALRTVANLAAVTLLIFDEQAARPRGGRTGGRLRAEEQGLPDPRFVCLGGDADGDDRARLVLLHRSRRQHYSPVFLDGRGVFDAASLPSSTRGLWPVLGAGARASADDGHGGGGKPKRLLKRQRQESIPRRDES